RMRRMANTCVMPSEVEASPSRRGVPRLAALARDDTFLMALSYGMSATLEVRSSADPFLRMVMLRLEAFATAPSSWKTSFDPFVLRSCETTVARGFVSNVISSGDAFCTKTTNLRGWPLRIDTAALGMNGWPSTSNGYAACV